MILLTPFTLFEFEAFYKRKRGDSNIYLRKLKAQGYIILEPVSVNHKNTYDFSCLPLKNIRMYNLCVLSNILFIL